ncbi:MAG: antitoxin component YwqK of YwqJK toxin-antitoxin module [Pseudoalteromonas distincta]|jgi:antitoxin component YwqK of YwqJK toxin-antitoxin module
MAAQSNIKADFRHEDDLLYYRESLFSGTFKSENDEVLEEKQYQKGLRHGIQKTFFLNGNLKQATMYTNGLKNGRSIEYYSCGAKKMNASYTEGVLGGTLEEWDDSGVLKARKTYFNGKLIAAKVATY